MNLYFGCRNRNLDFIYKDELNELETGLPFRVYVATSREPSSKKVKIRSEESLWWLVARALVELHERSCSALAIF